MQHPDEDEADWIRQAQGGGRQAFAELAKRYWSRLFRWLRGMTGCAHAAEDLTQEVFLKAWQALPGFREGNFRGWLFSIARNALIDRARAASANPAPGPLLEDLSAHQVEPVERLIEKEARRSIDDACRKLPEHVRSAFLLWVHEKMTYAEIAAALEITEVTARWRVHRARRLLMHYLKIPAGHKNP